MLSSSELKDLSCLFPWLQCLFGEDLFARLNLHHEFDVFFHHLECSFFESHILEVARSYPHFSLPPNLRLTQIYCDDRYIRHLDEIVAACKDDKEIMELFAHIIFVVPLFFFVIV